MLHNNRDLFEQAVLKTAEYLNIDAGIVEKDYYVTIMLKEISMTVPDLVFKGGTSLSKCYKAINRFSEDIDLTIEYDTKPTESTRRNLKKSIIAAIDKYDFELANPEDIKSRREFNKYIVNYPSEFMQSGLKNHLQIETMIKIKSYPNRVMSASSLIYDYLSAEGFDDIIKEYEIEPFMLKAQIYRNKGQSDCNNSSRICRWFSETLLNEGQGHRKRRFCSHCRQHLYGSMHDRRYECSLCPSRR